MLLDMDAELQHLISISIDKMTSGAGSGLAGRSDRKSRGMDLRKALLVAHVLQEVRCAYLEEDFEIVANTISDMRSDTYKRDYDVSNEFGTVKDLDERRNKESETYLIDSDPELPSSASPSVLQSCVTNTDVTVSRIAQVTRPVSVSINTAHVMSFQRLSDLAEKAADNGDDCDDSSVICEELELSHCCEVVSCDDDTQAPQQQQQQQAEPRDCAGAVNRMEGPGSSEGGSSCENAPTDAESSPLRHREQQTCQSQIERTPLLTNTSAPLAPATTPSTVSVVVRSNCPLPRKKRPLPKEFLADSTPAPKSPKTALSPPSVVSRLHTDYSAATATVTSTVTMESRTSTSISTVYSTTPSTITTTTSRTSTSSGGLASGPKVVVQMTQSCDAYLPITCTQIHLGKRLGDISNFTLSRNSALA